MPTYDFRCSTCDREEVIYCSYQDRDAVRGCPACGDEAMKRTWKQMPGLTRASYVDGHRREAVSAYRATRQIERAMERGDLDVKKGAQEIFDVRTKGTGGSSS